LGSAANADRLAEHCRRLEVPTGGIIAREGEPAVSMHFILEGRIGIVVNVGDARTMRVRSLGPHTTIGEMGLITGRPRSATIAAEADSVLYELKAEDYERIKLEDPALSQALLGYIVSVMSERLSFANRAVGVLQR
jgi:SulP family sulfate permease